MSAEPKEKKLFEVIPAADIVEEAISLFKEQDYLEERQTKAYNWAMAEAKVLDNISAILTREINR